MDVFVARQPIFNKKRQLFGYELLFRSGMNNSFPDLDGDIATSSLLSSSFFSFGIEKIAGGRKSFINFTEALLLKGTPALFPREIIMVEILESVRPTPEMLAACRSLKSQGYTLALDDFVFDESYAELLSMVDIVKIDFQSDQKQNLHRLKDWQRYGSCKFLAEKIETYAEFQEALALGFSLFQGYFFAKPEVLRNRDIPPNKLTSLRLISEIHQREFNVDALEALIGRDVAVSYKLLKYLNSAYFGRLAPLRSIRQAIAYLGERGVRLFVSLIATSQLADNKPDELVRLSIIRARFLELLGQHTGGQNDGELFLLGLFSLIDAMLDNPMDHLVKRLPVGDQVRQALVERGGPLAPYLHFVESLERARWEEVEALLRRFGLNEEATGDMYLEAIGWADCFETSTGSQ